MELPYFMECNKKRINFLLKQVTIEENDKWHSLLCLDIDTKEETYLVVRNGNISYEFVWK